MRRTRKILFVVCGSLTIRDRVRHKPQASFQQEASPAARLTLSKHRLASLSLKVVGFLAQCVSSGRSGEKQSCYGGLGFLKSQQEHLTMESSSSKQLFSCAFFFFFLFISRNVVNEMRGSLESVPLQILQLCWHTSSCALWILVMRMELPLLTFLFLLSVLIASLISALKEILHLG